MYWTENLLKANFYFRRGEAIRPPSAVGRKKKKMRFLHTSDWHLGQKFIYHDRRAEHQQALEWLLETIRMQKIDCLLVSGDIFDIGNPPNYARKLYYQFLRQVAETGCRHVVITAGNHDSPAMLDAPKELLQLFNMHIVSRANVEDVTQELIELKDAKGKLEAVIAAVPFLRDQDVRKSVSGETGLERVHAIRRAIRTHYAAVGEAMEVYAKKSVPLIAMGHLFVKDALVSAKHDNIYIGDTANIEASEFPEVFDYVALGHIHRPQALDEAGRVQYSGSIIPLSFSETKDEKVVKILDFKKRKFKLESIAIPTFRRLKTVKKTNLEEVKARLQTLAEDYKEGLPVWVEVVLESDKAVPDLDIQLSEWTVDMNLEILKIRTTHQYQSLDAALENLSLQDLEPIEVFQKKLNQTNLSDSERSDLVDTFKELQAWMGEQD